MDHVFGTLPYFPTFRVVAFVSLVVDIFQVRRRMDWFIHPDHSPRF